MPDDRHVPGTATERAAFHASLTSTRDHGRAALEEVRESGARHRLILESAAVERRILRDDYEHWNERRA
jgi:hypothetical protein